MTQCVYGLFLLSSGDHNAADCSYIGCSSNSAGWKEGQSARRLAAHLRPGPQLLSPGGWIDDMWVRCSRDLFSDLASYHSQVQSASIILKQAVMKKKKEN